MNFILYPNYCICIYIYTQEKKKEKPLTLLGVPMYRYACKYAHLWFISVKFFLYIYIILHILITWAAIVDFKIFKEALYTDRLILILKHRLGVPHDRFKHKKGIVLLFLSYSSINSQNIIKKGKFIVSKSAVIGCDWLWLVVIGCDWLWSVYIKSPKNHIKTHIFF